MDIKVCPSPVWSFLGIVIILLITVSQAKKLTEVTEDNCEGMNCDVVIGMVIWLLSM